MFKTTPTDLVEASSAAAVGPHRCAWIPRRGRLGAVHRQIYSVQLSYNRLGGWDGREIVVLYVVLSRFSW